MKYFDISLSIKRHNNVNAYGIDEPHFNTCIIGNFVGDIRQGGACNCEYITLNAHGNGTHTECMAHAFEVPFSMLQININPFLKARLLSIVPITDDDGHHFISAESIPDNLEQIDALVIRTLPNNETKISKKYVGTNPCFIHPSAMQKIYDLGIEHLLVDLPSVDPENDDGKLGSHKIFWGQGSKERYNATITELIYVPNSINDGLYTLNLQMALMDSDAVPSRPLLIYE